MMRSAKMLVVGIMCFSLGIVTGAVFGDRFGKENAETFSEMREGENLLINPLLECDSAKASLRSRALKPFEDNISSAIQRIRGSRTADSLSMYFRELNDGLWLSVGDAEDFTPVSLLKVPLMMAIFKQAERSPSFLQRQIRYDEPSDLNQMQSIRPSKTLQRGRSYSIEQLVEQMIVYSDNNAFNLLEGAVDPDVYMKLYRDLGIRMAFYEQSDYTMSVKEYATFFRVLYNSSYLGRDMSAKGLDLLSHTEYRQGLAAGVPGTVTVASKFGEGGDSRTAELHECGIVYYPQHPYLLCIMSRGQDADNLKTAIAALSRTVYEAVDMQHTNRH